MVILVNADPRHDWLVRAINQRLREELATLQVDINEEKTRIVDLAKGEYSDSWGLISVASAA